MGRSQQIIESLGNSLGSVSLGLIRFAKEEADAVRGMVKLAPVGEVGEVGEDGLKQIDRSNLDDEARVVEESGRGCSLLSLLPSNSSGSSSNSSSSVGGVVLNGALITIRFDVIISMRL